MPFPVYLNFGQLHIHPHLLFEALAYGFAFRLYLALRHSRGDSLDDSNRWWIVAAASSGAFIGALVLAALERPGQLLALLRDSQAVLGGKTIVGALIGGLFAVEWAKRRLGIKRRTGDLFAVPLCVGIAVGRIGCFLTGLQDHTCGLPSALPWAVNFGDGIPRHPTQLYEIVFLGFLALVIFRMSLRHYIEGDLFKFFMVSYFAFRLLIDFLKPDPPILLNFSSIQLACIAMLVYYSRDFDRLSRELLFPDSLSPAKSSSPPSPHSTFTRGCPQ